MLYAANADNQKTDGGQKAVLITAQTVDRLWRRTMIKKLTPMKAIRLKCLDCCNWQASEVKLCPIDGCPIHAFRMGHRPDNVPTYDTGRELTEEQKKNIAVRLNTHKKNADGGDMDG